MFTHNMYTDVNWSYVKIDSFWVISVHNQVGRTVSLITIKFQVDFTLRGLFIILFDLSRSTMNYLGGFYLFVVLCQLGLLHVLLRVMDQWLDANNNIIIFFNYYNYVWWYINVFNYHNIICICCSFWGVRFWPTKLN